MTEDTARNTSPALSLDALIRRQKLTTTDRKATDTAVAEIGTILKVIARNRPSSHGTVSKLHLAADKAESILVTNPTAENAEALHDALVRHRDAEVSFTRIDAALNLASRTRIDSLRPVAERILDAVEADLETEAAKRREEFVKADAVFGESGDASEFDRRLARTRSFLADERVAIRQNGAALDWLAKMGFTENPFLSLDDDDIDPHAD